MGCSPRTAQDPQEAHPCPFIRGVLSEAAPRSWETGLSLDPCEQGVSASPLAPICTHLCAPVCCGPGSIAVTPPGQVLELCLLGFIVLARHLTLSEGPVMWLPSRATRGSYVTRQNPPSESRARRWVRLALSRSLSLAGVFCL